MNWKSYASILVVLDQASKLAITQVLAYGEQVPFTAFFNLVHVTNPGAAFSFLANAGGWQRYGLSALALGVSVWLMCELQRKPPPIEATAYCLILGGALGNVVDRLVRGEVVDFLDFHWMGMHWPAFNLADGMIFVGALCVIRAALNRKLLQVD
ncbi:MAG: signal peptidase II [Polaromonas sp.]|jgi:signal peptidase II|nr:signal peptidase II [Polaromonas sp.]MDI1268058.1 signal peptidase II [Polaromonas sp.]